MLTLRENCTLRQSCAHAILDAARIGLEVDGRAIRWALRTLGEIA